MWPGYENPGKACKEQGGCIDDSPALDFVGDILAQFPEGYKRAISMGAGDANTGEFVVFN